MVLKNLLEKDGKQYLFFMIEIPPQKLCGVLSEAINMILKLIPRDQ